MSETMVAAAEQPQHPEHPPEQPPRGSSEWQSHMPLRHSRRQAHAAQAAMSSKTTTVDRLNSIPKIMGPAFLSANQRQTQTLTLDYFYRIPKRAGTPPGGGAPRVRFTKRAP